MVLRSWEDRFGARLLEVGYEDIRLLVSRPPQTLEAAQRIAAEHMVFSDEAHQGLSWVGGIARTLVNNPFWDFWWGRIQLTAPPATRCASQVQNILRRASTTATRRHGSFWSPAPFSR